MTGATANNISQMHIYYIYCTKIKGNYSNNSKEDAGNKDVNLCQETPADMFIN